MNAGYVRLSKDDDRKNYISIENQKLIISQYATEHGEVIDQWYEDDGISGYIFDRPGLNQLMDDLNTEIDTVFVKDFSRLGRHSARVQLLVEFFKESGKHLIVIDDNFDSKESEDDTLGITTWFNERYVKDTSKKIRRVLGAKQKEGTLLVKAPFGYLRSKKDNSSFEIVPKEAECVRMVYDLYIQGYGYRKISTYLTHEGFSTPSMIQHERELREGTPSKRAVATEWTDSMVKDILGNDFYVGTLRLHKRARATIHGRDRRVPKEEQYVFEDNHEPIIDRMTFELVQELKEKRNRQRYRGSRGQWIGSTVPNPFGSTLYCKDCGSKLTPIVRKTSAGERKYYICSAYNTKGKRYCSKAHLIEENDLMDDVLHYIRLCRNVLSEVILTYDMKDFETEKKTVEGRRQYLGERIVEEKKQLKALISQKVKDLAAAPDNEDIIHESYDALQQDILSRIHGYELQLKELQETSLETEEVKEKLETALDVVDDIIRHRNLNRKDIEILIDRIIVDENGLPEIQLKYGLSGLIPYSPAEELNKRENEIIQLVIKLIMDDTRGYTSAKYLSEQLTAAGFKKSKKAVLPYISLMLDMGVIEESQSPKKPYTIVKSKEEIARYLHCFDVKGWYAPDGI